MVRDSPPQRMDAYLRERADRPFGDTELASNQTLAPFSRAGLDAADNLLIKAERALTAGDAQAAHYIDRAVGLDYDRHEQTTPAGFAAGMMLFDAVVDALEASAEGDSRWLEAAIEAMSSADSWGQSEMRHVLLAVRQDYVMEQGEADAILAATAEAPVRTQLRDLPPGTEDLAEAVTSVLQLVITYRSALEASGW